MKTQARRILIFPLAAFALLLFQNCGQFEVAQSGKIRQSSYNFAKMGQDSLQPDTDKLDTNCMSKNEFDACLFQKNPVAQRQSALVTSSVVSTNLDSVQIYGVKLTGISPTSGAALDNGTIKVESLNGTAPTRTALKTKAQNDAGRVFSQVNVYYWLNRTVEYMSRRTGVFPAQNKGIRVIVDDSLSGWAPHNNTIHLHATDAGNTMAWSPEIAIHFLGLANLYYATDGTIEPPSASKHATCALKAGGCCVSQSGCSRAIASGVGDYLVAVMFPTQAKLGEMWTNTTDGLTSCGLSRSLESATKRTASAAYGAGSSQNRTGDVSAMGTIYASIWWEVRKAYIKQNPTNGDVEIDALFMNHLFDLDGTDDFKSALAKIKALDATAFQSRHVSFFEAEYTGRGL